LSSHARHLKREEGMTLVEVIVAMFLLALIVGALADAFVNNNQSALASQRQTQLLSILEQRIEYVHQVLTQNYATTGFSTVALRSNPSKGVDTTLPGSPTDPNDFITPYVTGFTTSSSGTAENFLIEKNYNSTSEGTIDGGSQTYSEELEVDPTNGKIDPVVYVDTVTGTTYVPPATVPVADPYVTVYTFITATTLGSNTTLTACNSSVGVTTATGDGRRVIVAAVPSPTGRTDLGSNTPQYSSTILGAPIPGNQCQAASGLRIGLNIS
jgi:type II secretory pathway pseudopilin PulG